MSQVNPIIMYESMLNDCIPTATSTATDYDVLNLRDLRLFTYWKATGTTDPQYITCDVGSGNTKAADSLAIIGHNLNAAGASVTLQCSTDDFVSDIDYILAKLPSTDGVLLSEALVVPNGDVEVWSDGASSPPDGWTAWAPGGGSIARDAVDFKTGLYSAKLTNSAGNEGLLGLYDTMVPGLDPSYWSGKTVSFGMWVKTSSASRVHLIIYSVNGSPEYIASSFHTGGGGWEWLTVTTTLRSGLTQLILRCQIDSGTSITANFDGVVFKEAGSVASTDTSDYLPVSVSRRYWRLKIGGPLSVAPYMAILMIGDKLQFPYPEDAPYKPFKNEIRGETQLGRNGHHLGSVVDYHGIKITANFSNLSRTFVFDTYKPFWDDHAKLLKPFFYAADIGTFPELVFFVRVPDNAVFEPPLSISNLVDRLTIPMEGLEEAT